MKGGTNQNPAAPAPKNQSGNAAHQAKIQPTAEQIRYAKLAQMPGLEDSQIKEKIKEVSEVTGKSSDVVSVALHESNYEVSMAIQNILDGKYDCLDTEWQTRKPAKKKKNPTAVPATNLEKTQNQNDNEVVENHVNEDESASMPVKSGKSIRGGKRGGRPKRLDDNVDVKNIDDDGEKEPKSRDASERRGFVERGRGRPRGRGRGGIQRGGGTRRGGYGGRSGNFSGPGRGGSRARGRGFPRRSRSDRENQISAKEEEKEEPLAEEKEEESWDIDDDVDKPDWADQVEAEEKSQEWSQDQWIAPVSEDNTASLFANSIMSSTAQVDNWSHVNGPETKWGRTSPKEEPLYRPENVDAAVIMSQRAQPSSEPAAYQTTNDHSRPTYTSSLHDSQFPSSHQDTSLTSSLLGHAYNIDDLAKVTMKNNVTEASNSASSATMISGVHDSHKLEQQQLQPKAQRQPKPKRSQKPQIPSQPVEMPNSTVEELEQQLGGLEFGSGPISPKFGTETKPSFASTSPVTTTIFQQSSTANLTSTIHHETVRHSVAIPEVSTKIATVSSLTSTNASKNERPKTPPGLSSLQEHQSPGRHFSPSSPRDLKRLVQVPDPIPFPPNTRPTTQSMTTASSLNQPNDDLQSSLPGSFASTRNVLNASIASVQDNSINIGNDPRSLATQPMLDLGELPLGNHLQQKQVSSTFVGETYGSASINKTLAQPSTAASFTKPSIAPPPGVLPSSSHVTYSSSTLASQVLGFTSTASTTTAQTAPKALANTSKSSSSGPPGMMPMNVYAGMQQIPAAYPTYSFEEMQVLQRMPMHSYYDVMGSNYQAGDSKFARDGSSPVASTINTGNPHAAHAQQQAAFLGAAAAATPLQYGYAYYGPGMIPGTFPVFTTAPVYQMQGGKGHMGGMQYQSAAYNTQHGSHAYNSAASQDFEKGSYHRTGTQSHTKNGQTAGSLTAGSTSTENIHHSGFKSQFNQDTKGYQLTATPPSMNIPLPHGQNHMTSYAPYMMQQHHASMMHQASGHVGHQQLDSTNQGGLASRTQHHSMATSQQQKRDVKTQGYGSSYWPGNN